MELEIFRNPGAIYRNAPFWSWNDRLLKDELKRQLDEMASKGWGGSFMHSRVGLVTGYLSDEWMDSVKECVKHAAERGISVWIYDEDKWPSGFAGGILPETDASFRSRALILTTPDRITTNDTVMKECLWDGEKAFICLRVEELGNLWFNGTSYVDLMNPLLVKAFLNCTHEKYRELFEENFGHEIPGIFTDEPCYNLNTQYGSTPYVPWSDYLPDFFRELKGYDITGHIEQLFFDTGDYRKIRFDFYDAATRLFLQSFSQQYYDWCEKNNLKLTGHYMAEDNLISQTKWIGAAMPHYQFMHWPGIDKLVRNIEQLATVKQLTSAADQLGKERTLSEVFGSFGQQSNFFHRKWITDWQAVLGINFVNSHLSLYSMRGERKRDFPANLFLQQPWWDDEKPFADYTARLNKILSAGKRKLDILVIHPIASVWSEYSPLHGGKDNGYNLVIQPKASIFSSLRGGKNSGNAIEKSYDYVIEKSLYNEPFDQLSKFLIENKLDFHYGDEILLENFGSIDSGKIVVGCHTYSTVIVPPVLTLRSNTVRLLEEFISSSSSSSSSTSSRSGHVTGNVIFIGPLPQRIDGSVLSGRFPIDAGIGTADTPGIPFPDWSGTAKTLPALPGGVVAVSVKSADEAISLLNEIYPDRIRITDHATDSNASSVICHERLTDDGMEIIFFANTSEKRKATVSISIITDKQPILFDLMTGQYHKIPCIRQGENVSFTCTLYPAGSLTIFLVNHHDMNDDIHKDMQFDIRKDMLVYSGTGVDFAQHKTPDYINECGCWNITPMEENVLPLHYVTLFIDGQKVLENKHVAYAWHNYFYNLPDGTGFKAEYSFNLDEVPEFAGNDLTAVIEMAENLDKITLNGLILKALKDSGDTSAFDALKSWKDINFTRVPLGNALLKGRNILSLEGKKRNNITGPGFHERIPDFNAHKPTELETVYIIGNFSVKGDSSAGYSISAPKPIICSEDLTKQGYPFYAGKVEFKTFFNISHATPCNLYFMLKDVEAASIKLFINGNLVNTAYYKPFVFDITGFVREGRNEASVIASTTLFNLFGPNWISDIENKLFIGPKTFIDFKEFTDDLKLFPFGIGKGCLYTIQEHTLHS